MYLPGVKFEILRVGQKGMCWRSEVHKHAFRDLVRASSIQASIKNWRYRHANRIPRRQPCGKLNLIAPCSTSFPIKPKQRAFSVTNTGEKLETVHDSKARILPSFQRQVLISPWGPHRGPAMGK